MIYWEYKDDYSFESDCGYPTKEAAQNAAVEHYNDFMDENRNADPDEYYILKYDLNEETGDFELLEKETFEPKYNSKRNLVCYPC